MKLFFSVFYLIALSGCASISVSINSYNNGQLPKGTCCIVSGSKDVTESDLQFVEFSEYLKRALEKIGYTVVSNVKKAKCLIFLNYGISEPKEYNGTISTPVYGQTGVSNYTYSNIFGGSYTISQPTYGVVGNSQSSYSYNIYTEWILLGAYSRKKNTKGQLPQLWQTKMASAGEQVDLRRDFSNMLGASLPYLATNTGKIVDVNSFIDRDKNILYIKGISNQRKDLSNESPE